MDFDTSLHLTGDQLATYLLALTFAAFFFPMIFRFLQRTVKTLRGFLKKTVSLYHQANSYLLKLSHTKEVRN